MSGFEFVQRRHLAALAADSMVAVIQ